MRYAVEMMIDDVWYTYGTWTDRNRANEVAIEIRDTRDVFVRVIEKQD